MIGPSRIITKTNGIGLVNQIGADRVYQFRFYLRILFDNNHFTFHDIREIRFPKITVSQSEIPYRILNAIGIRSIAIDLRTLEGPEICDCPG